MLTWLARRFRRDEGAAAVEFALIIPVFVTLVFGVLTGGIMLWKFIGVTQAARDASRYGSTLSIQVKPGAPGETEAQWLTDVENVAIHQAWNGASTLTDDGYVCVAYVRGDPLSNPNTGTIQTMSLWSGTAPSTGAPASDAPCLPLADDSRTDDRVQVVIGRTADFDAIFFHWTPRLTSHTVIVYERPSSAKS